MLRRKSLEQQCEITNNQFTITTLQREAYEYFDLPLPTISPSERLRHRLSFISDCSLFWVRCSETSQRMISIYSPRSPFAVVDNSYWESDDFKPLSYGRDYEFADTFVDQLNSLWSEVPRPALNSLESSDNSGCSDVFQVNSSSMVFSSAFSEHCLHSSHLYKCSHCADCHSVSNSKWCYESIYLDKCTEVCWGYDSQNCSQSYFIANCTNCSNCLFCANIENAQYCVFNEQLSKEEYEKVLNEWNLSSDEKISLAKQTFHSFCQDHSLGHIAADDPDTNTGNYLRNTSRTTNSYECYGCDNCIDCNMLFDSKNSLDCFGFGVNVESCAQNIGVGVNAKNVFNSVSCWNNVELLEYCSHCENSRNLFACVGLRNAEYCILNKQYSKEDYESLRLSIVSRLKERDIWGRYLPASFSAFEYNHSLAQVLMPLLKVSAQLLGFRWDASDPLVRPSQLKSRMGTEFQLAHMPTSAEGLESQSASREVFLCELTGQPYTVSSQEREFYREMKIAPPRRSPVQRFDERMKNMTPRVIEERDGMQTAFPAEWYRPVIEHSKWKQQFLKKINQK